MLIKEVGKQEIQNLLVQYDWRDPKYLKEATAKVCDYVNGLVIRNVDYTTKITEIDLLNKYLEQGGKFEKERVKHTTPTVVNDLSVNLNQFEIFLMKEIMK